MKWLAVALVVYAVLSNSGGNKDVSNDKIAALDVSDTSIEQRSGTPETMGQEIIADAKKSLKLSQLEDKFIPQKVKKLTIEDTLSGQGGFVTCGQKVVVNYRKLPNEAFDKLEFIIGVGAAPVALEQGIMGMSRGGKRKIFTPDNEQFEVELGEVMPILPDFSAYRILGDTSEGAKSYKCGSAVKLNVVIRSVEGKKLFDSKDNDGKPISFTIGRSEVFLGLEQGALGMSVPSRRTLVVPPDFLKTMNGNAALINFPIAKKRIVIVDIESVP